MTNDLFTSLVADLDQILEEERRILLSGNLDQMVELVERKERVIDQLAEAEATDAEALGALNDKLKRNQALLDQALEGIRTVAKRLSALRRVRRSLDTYDARGEKQAIDMGKPVTVEKRA